MTKGVVGVIESTTRLEALTASLVGTTAAVESGIRTVANSSEELETLTKKLNWLTWALIWLTAITIGLTVGIEVLHTMREIEAPVPPIVIQHPLPVAPQAPPLPAR